MPIARALACLLLSVTTAHAEHGAMVGLRDVSLEGDIDDRSRTTFAFAGILMYELPRGLALGVEPGFRISGSRSFRMMDLVVPVAARYAHAFTAHHHLRITLALAPAFRLSSARKLSTDDGDEWEDIPGVRAWDLDIVFGIGYEHAHGVQRYFVDIRHARGLASVDDRERPLAIYRRELGLWFGVTR